MAIRGNLQEAGLPDVIQMLHLGRRSGCLALADRGMHASVYFDEGWITHADIVNRRDRLGDLLVRNRRVTAAQLEQAIELQARSRKRRLGEVLIDLGAISRDELRRWIRYQVEDAVYSLFAWRTGSFTFEPGMVPAEGTEPFRLSPEGLLLEGARRVDEWFLIEQKIPSFDLIFARDRPPGPRDELDYTEVQHRLLALLDGTRDVRTLVEEAGLTEFETCQALFGLLSAGLIHRVGTSMPGPSARSLEARIDEHRNLGVAFYRTGMLEEAAREFRRVSELRPAEGAAPFHLGLIAVREGRWADAVYFFRAAAERGGPRVATLHNLGLSLAGVGEHEAAATSLAEATSREPADARAHLAWGITAIDQGEVVAGRARITRAGELFGDARPAVWYWAASRAAALTGDPDRAAAVAAEAVARWPGHPVLLNNHAVFLEAAGALAEAERVLGQALELDPGAPEISKNLGDVLYRLGRYDESWEAYLRAERAAPELGDDLHFKMGNLALRRGETEVARGHWESAVRLNPGHQLARANLDALGAGT